MSDAALREAHALALDLRCGEALDRIPSPSSMEALYVASLSEAIELLVTEDYSKFTPYEERFLERLEKKSAHLSPVHQFVQAEMRLHWAFVYLKFGHELDAALYLRQAFLIATACREAYPDFMPIRKTTGLLGVIVGSVPDKYSWVLSLLSLRGSVDEGLNDLKMASTISGPLAFEAQLLYALVQGFVLANPEDGLKTLQQARQERRDNRLALFFSASLALKSGQNELALRMLQQLSESPSGTPLYYSYYLSGEAYLHKGSYTEAIASYRRFLDHQTGQNYIKDAWYKTGLCYWLDGRPAEAQVHFEEARAKGKESTEADKAAARSLSEAYLPHVGLSKARYFTDGGYYDEAADILSRLSPDDFLRPKERVEYYYRRARLAHKTGSAEAVDLYLKTVEMAGDATWYFAPNACLQLGYICQEENRPDEAAGYFRRALSYKRHEYKNSIDSKARSALAQLKRI